MTKQTKNAKHVVTFGKIQATDFDRTIAVYVDGELKGNICQKWYYDNPHVPQSTDTTSFAPDDQLRAAYPNMYGSGWETENEMRKGVHEDVLEFHNSPDKDFMKSAVVKICDPGANEIGIVVSWVVRGETGQVAPVSGRVRGGTPDKPVKLSQDVKKEYIRVLDELYKAILNIDERY